MTGDLGERAAFYSSWSFLLDPARAADDFAGSVADDLAGGSLERIDLGSGVGLYLRSMTWDTGYFGVPTFRLDYIDLPQRLPTSDLSAAMECLWERLESLYPEHYLFAEVPAEDTRAIAALGNASWHLVETRLTWFRDDIQGFDFSMRSITRDATEADIPALRQVAAKSVNRYDRFHADDFFSSAEADEFLATFAENSVRGFADVTMVPASGASNAFLTANYLPEQRSLPGRRLARMVLSAVAPERRGWYVRLIAEMSFRFKERGVDTAFMTTQATNRAVLKVWQRLGYRYGRCTHIFSRYRRARAADPSR